MKDFFGRWNYVYGEGCYGPKRCWVQGKVITKSKLSKSVLNCIGSITSFVGTAGGAFKGGGANGSGGSPTEPLWNGLTTLGSGLQALGNC